MDCTGFDLTVIYDLYGDLQSMEILFDAGVDINVKYQTTDDGLKTPLEIAEAELSQNVV